MGSPIPVAGWLDVTRTPKIQIFDIDTVLNDHNYSMQVSGEVLRYNNGLLLQHQHAKYLPSGTSSVAHAPFG